MKQLFALFILAAVSLFAQKKETKEMSQQEQQDLQESLSLAGSSPVEFVRALEIHLKKYPDSPRKNEMLRGLVKAAIETKDHRRVVLYGEQVLAGEPDDVLLLELVAGGLLTGEDKAAAERSLRYSQRLEKLIQEKVKADPEFAASPRIVQQSGEMLSRSYALQARATGLLGKLADAVALAQKSYGLNPSAESAREVARWLQKAGREEEAIRWLADAFMLADRKPGDTMRAKDRQNLGELYRKLHGSEKGLGDALLEAYDRTSGLAAEKRKNMREIDPNAGATEPLDFTITSLKGEKLNLATLKGKVVVIDFWATWCGPCRAQKPIYDAVKKEFADEKNVVFLAITTDEDHSAVEPFLEELKWSKAVYFDDGMAEALRVSSIPTAMILNRKGEIVSRMNGFVAERFADMLTERIKEALVE